MGEERGWTSGTGTSGGRWRQRRPRMESWDLRAETGPQMSRGRPGLISQISRQGWEWNKRKTAVLAPCLLLMRVLACRRVRPAQDGRPFFWLFKALRPCAQQMNEPRGGVARDGRSTNGVKELCPTGGLARAQYQTLPEGSNMTTSVRSSPTTSETASRTLHLSRILPNNPSHIHRSSGGEGMPGQAVRSCSWMGLPGIDPVPDPA